MNIPAECKELFRLLTENRVDYMVVGGYAVAFQGHPRFTKAIDIFYESSPANVARLRTAMVAFGFEGDELMPSKSWCR